MTTPEIAHAFVRAINRRIVEEIVNLIPDYSIAIDETYAEGSVVVLLGTAQGTYAGGSLPPENRWTTPAAWRALVRGALIAEWRVYADLDPLRQIMARTKK